MNDFERLLSESLKSVGDSYSPGDIQGAQEEFLRRRKRRKVALFAGSAAAAAGVAVVATLIVVASSNDPLGEPVRPAQQRVAVVGDTIPVGDKPNGVALGFDSVWVANTGDGTVSRISGAGDQVESIRVGGRPEDLAAGADGMWVTDPRRGLIHRIDPATNEVVAQSDLQGQWRQLDIAAGAEAVVAVGDGVVYYVDPATAKLARVEDPDGYRTTDVVMSEDAVYLLGNGTGSNSGSAVVARYPADAARISCVDNPDCGPVVQTVSGDAANGDAVLGEENVIVSLADGRLFRFDLDTLETTGDLADGSWVRVPAPGTFAAVSVGERFVWVLTGDSTSDGALIQVNPSSASVVQALALGGGPNDLVVGEGAVWVTNHDAGTVTRLDLVIRPTMPIE